MRFREDRATAAFEKRLRAYEAHVNGLPSDPGPSARGLPETLIWSLWFLRLALPAKHQPSDDSLIETAFRIARNLLDGHCRQMAALRAARLLAEQLLLAEKIAEDIAARRPMKLRDIVRLFRLQKKERFEPVLQALIETGVLVRDEGGVYHPGPVEFGDAEDTLARMFEAAGTEEPANQAESAKSTRTEEADPGSPPGREKPESAKSLRKPKVPKKDPKRPPPGADTTDEADRTAARIAVSDPLPPHGIPP